MSFLLQFGEDCWVSGLVGLSEAAQVTLVLVDLVYVSTAAEANLVLLE